jgi:hypothetical protein
VFNYFKICQNPVVKSSFSKLKLSYIVVYRFKSHASGRYSNVFRGAGNVFYCGGHITDKVCIALLSYYMKTNCMAHRGNFLEFKTLIT